MAGSDLLLQDTNLSVTVAIPAASGTALTSAIDLNNRTKDQFDPERTQIKLDLPVLNSTQLPDTRTVTYEVYTSDNATPGSGSPVLRQTYTVTGASSAGAAAATKVFLLPQSTERYLYLKITAGASTAATASSGTLYLVF